MSIGYPLTYPYAGSLYPAAAGVPAPGYGAVPADLNVAGNTNARIVVGFTGVPLNGDVLYVGYGPAKQTLLDYNPGGLENGRIAAGTTTNGLPGEWDIAFQFISDGSAPAAGNVKVDTAGLATAVDVATAFRAACQELYGAAAAAGAIVWPWASTPVNMQLSLTTFEFDAVQPGAGGRWHSWGAYDAVQWDGGFGPQGGETAFAQFAGDSIYVAIHWGLKFGIVPAAGLPFPTA